MIEVEQRGILTEEEYEIKFPEEDFLKMGKIISNITEPDQIIKGTQKRENYKMGDVEIAIKQSEDWKYHFELECLIEDGSKKGEATKKLYETANILAIQLMTMEEEKKFIDEVRGKKK